MRKNLTLLSIMLAFSLSLFAAQVQAAPKLKNTGSAVRVKKIAFIKVKVYYIAHYMAEFPKTKSKRAIINADTDKKMALKMLRTVAGSKLKKAVKDAFHLNGYRNNAKINKFLSVLKGEAKEGSWISIKYNSKAKTTTIYYSGKRRTIPGVDFMKGTWSCWFGKINQPSLPRRLMRKIP